MSGALPAKIDESLISLLDASFRKMSEQGDRLAVVFYDRLFAQYPPLRSMFPADLTDQRGKLLDTLGVVVASLRRPDEVRDRLRRLGALHADAGVRSEQYPIVCRVLLESMAAVTGEAWTPLLQQEWTRALELISRLMLEGAAKPGAAVTERL